MSVDPEGAPVRVRAVLVVFAGGVGGALARYLLEEAVPLWHGVPVVTLAINVSGAFLLGLLLGSGPRTEVRLLLGTGFLGAFTTYSSLAVDGDLLLSDGRIGAGAAYLLVTVIPGVVAAAAGLATGSRIERGEAR